MTTIKRVLLPALNCALCACLLVSFSVQAENVRLGRNANATEQAVAALILSDIYRGADLNAVITPMPASRANAAAVAGKTDGEVGRIQAYADNNPSLIKVEPAYYYITTTGFAKDGSGIVLNSKEDLKGLSVGVIRGVAHTAAVTQGHPKTRVVGDASQLYKMLAAGRIDIALDAGINGPYMIKKLGLSGISAVGDLARLDLFAILHPDNAPLADRLSSVISDLKDENKLDSLAKRHEEGFLASGASN